LTVEELLTKQNIFYIPSGRDFLIRCLNPEHDDSNPSMRVDKTTGIYHCFSCHFKGNILSRFGVNRSKLEVLRQRVTQTIEKVRLESIGFQIPENAIMWEDEYRNISAQTLKKFKAFTYEKEFPNKLVFPITDVTGRITHFLGRSFDPFEKPRYKVHPPKVGLPLFPMTSKPKFGTIILVEGIFDFLNLYEHKVTWAMTGFGTTTPSEDKFDLLRLLGTTDIHILFDGDEPGQAAAEKIMTMADSKGFITRNIDLGEMFGEGTDPGSLNKEQMRKLKYKQWREYLS